MKKLPYPLYIVIAALCAFALNSCNKTQHQEAINLAGVHAWRGTYWRHVYINPTFSTDTTYQLHDTSFEIKVLNPETINVYGIQMLLQKVTDTAYIYYPPPTFCDCSQSLYYYYKSNMIKLVFTTIGSTQTNMTYVTP